MIDLIPILKELCEAFGPAGYEEEVRAVIRRHVQPLADEVHEDVLGNLVAWKKSASPRGTGRQVQPPPLRWPSNRLRQDPFPQMKRTSYEALSTLAPSGLSTSGLTGLVVLYIGIRRGVNKKTRERTQPEQRRP